MKAVEVIESQRFRFVLHAPWRDFLTFYATPATGAAWIVPKGYLERVGADGFLRHPIGLGPYRFVHSDPGVELVLEANQDYWRQVPSIERIIFKGVPERPTRLAMLKTGEADLPYDPAWARRLLAEAGYPIGVEVTIEVLDRPVFLRRINTDQDWDQLVNFSLSSLDAYSLSFITDSRGLNPLNQTDPKVDEL